MLSFQLPYRDCADSGRGEVYNLLVTRSVLTISYTMASDYLKNLFKGLFALFYLSWFACISACAPYAYMVTVEAQRGCWVQWSWSNNQLWAHMWVLRTDPGNLCHLQDASAPKCCAISPTLSFNSYHDHLFRTENFRPGDSETQRDLSKPHILFETVLFAGSISQQSWLTGGPLPAGHWVLWHLSVPRKEGSESLAAE